MTHNELNKSSSQLQKWQLLILFTFSVIFVGLCFLIIYKVPYNGDDMILCLTPGAILYDGSTIWDHTFFAIKTYLSQGRFYPLSTYAYAMYTLLPTLFAYRTFQLIVNLLLIISFSLLIQKITKNWPCAFFAMLLLPVLIQFRLFHDPVLGYSGLLQIVGLYLIWSLFLFVKYFDAKKSRYLVFSALLYSCCIMTYEISYSFIAIFILIAIHYAKGKKRLLSLLPHFIVICCILLITFYFRVNAVSSYTGTTFSFNLKEIVKTYAKQVIAALPLSYWIFSKPPFFIYNFQQYLAQITIWDICLTVLLSLLLFFVISLLPRKSKKSELFLYGLAFLLLPGTLISLSGRYQSELTIGIGYLPVYIEYFGVALIITSAILFIFSRVEKTFLRRFLAIILSLCVSCVFLVNSINNRLVQEAFANTGFYSTQAVAALSMRNGLMDSLHDNDSLISIGNAQGLTQLNRFVCLYADGLRISPKSLQDLVTIQEAKNPDSEILNSESGNTILFPENQYIFMASGTPECGLAELAAIDSIEYNSESMTIIHVYVTDITVILFNDGAGNIRVEQHKSDGTIASTEIPVTALYSNPDEGIQNKPLKISQGTSEYIEVNRISKINSVDLYKTIFALNQSKTCKLMIKSNGDPILFDTLSVNESN